MQPFIAGGGVRGPYTFTATGLPMAVRGARAGRGGRPRTRNARERLDRFRAIHRVCDVKLARGAPEAAAETRTCLGRRKANSVTVQHPRCRAGASGPVTQTAATACGADSGCAGHAERPYPPRRVPPETVSTSGPATAGTAWRCRCSKRIDLRGQLLENIASRIH